MKSKSTIMALPIIVIGAAVFFSVTLRLPSVPHGQAAEVNRPAKIRKNPTGPSIKSPPANPAEKPSPDSTHRAGRKNPASEESYNLILRGTVNWDTIYAQAVIEDSSEKKQRLYKIGDIIKTGIIKKIMRNNIIISLNGKDITVAMNTSVPFFKDNSLQPFTVKRSELKVMLDDVNGLMSQISIKPHVVDNGPSGLQIDTVVPGSLFDSLGFTKDDIITEINGSKIKRPRMLAAIYESMKLMPSKLLSLEDLGPTTKSVLLKLDKKTGGIADEVSRLHQKIESGEDIPIQFSRNGISQTKIFRVR